MYIYTYKYSPYIIHIYSPYIFVCIYIYPYIYELYHMGDKSRCEVWVIETK